jgi:hypothetical protein
MKLTRSFKSKVLDPRFNIQTNFAYKFVKCDANKVINHLVMTKFRRDMHKFDLLSLLKKNYTKLQKVPNNTSYKLKLRFGLTWVTKLG